MSDTPKELTLIDRGHLRAGRYQRQLSQLKARQATQAKKIARLEALVRLWNEEN